MKSKLYDITGKEKGTINLPSCFSEEIREDIVAKVLESQKIRQPYGPSPIAGNQSSASGKINHRRHVWKTSYGRGMSRIPRKVMSHKGSQFTWVGATVPGTRGGRRAHPPKIVAMVKRLLINKKEKKIAMLSALSATANTKYIVGKYETIENIKDAPFVIESFSPKVRELLTSMKNILGEELYNIAVKKKSVRSGRGKMRGRKYKSNAGALIVLGGKEKLKTNAFEVVNIKKLGVTNLAKGGLGRLTIYSQAAIKEIESNLGEKK